MLYVFENCRDFRRTIPALVYDARRPEDIDTAGEDHIYDETRYFLMSRPIAPRKRSAGPRGLGGDFEFLPLKSPRNPITPIETSRVATLHPGLYKGLREGAKGDRGDRKAPICNRQQGRRA